MKDNSSLKNESMSSYSFERSWGFYGLWETDGQRQG